MILTDEADIDTGDGITSASTISGSSSSDSGPARSEHFAADYCSSDRI